ncbi:hypothetical protein C9J27_02885 [Photobacterium kishitanii]|uniref:Uncharacterized protein n=1 Tax=Photobacterium kishitanii TaxID=318456 RepID=A0A2T3KMF4_9GAMM|nr:hypothetical protein C9J27_02885 [Photobacterium kishitanii]
MFLKNTMANAFSNREDCHPRWKAKIVLKDLSSIAVAALVVGILIITVLEPTLLTLKPVEWFFNVLTLTFSFLSFLFVLCLCSALYAKVRSIAFK